ncbi:MAG: hypothetical protein EOP09_14365, partial [Proteobacteria bacterium]
MSSLELFKKAKKPAVNLACGNVVDGERVYVFSRDVEDGDDTIFLLKGRNISHCEGADEKGYQFSNGLTFKAVALPTFKGWSDEGITQFLDGPSDDSYPKVFRDIVEILKTQIFTRDADQYALMAAFICASYSIEDFDSIGYLHMRGGYASGKTESAKTVVKMSFNGANEQGVPAVFGKGTAAALIKSIALNRFTFCADDLEQIQIEDPKDDLRQVLLTSYKKDSSQNILVERGQPTLF